MRILRTASTLALLTFVVSSSPVMLAQDSTRQIPIVAKKFGYSPSEVRLKKGETVTLVLKSEDAAHGLKSKDLALDARIEPGTETKVVVTPQAAGQFTAFCNVFCGSGHRDMKMTFIVE